MRCKADFFDDAGSDIPEPVIVPTCLDLFHRAMKSFHRSLEEPIHFESPYHYLSFRMAGALPMDLNSKQELLPLRQERQRLENVAA